jgi:hypothetical protein
MSDYKGIYYNDKKDPRYFEGGAHFRYRDLFSVLQSLMITQTASSTHKRTFTFSPNQQTLPKPKTRNVIFYDTKHMHNTNKTNSFLLRNNKKNTSLEKQTHHYSNVILHHNNNNNNSNSSNSNNMHINAVSRNSDYAALHKRKNNIDINNCNVNNICSNNNIALKKHSLNNSNSSNMILFPKSQYKSNCIECMNNSNSGILLMKGHTSRNVNNNCHTKSLDMNAKEFNMNNIHYKHNNEYDNNSNTNDDIEMSKCDYNRFSIKNMKMKLLKKNATSTSGLNGIYSYHKNKDNVVLQRNNHNSVLNNNNNNNHNNNNNSSYHKDNTYNNTVIQRRNSYKNVLPRNIKTNSDVLFKEVFLSKNGYCMRKGSNGKTVYFK